MFSSDNTKMRVLVSIIFRTTPLLKKYSRNLPILKFFQLLLFAIFTICMAGLIDHHEKATSYQSFHMEHFHPVPTFIKKEHLKLLEHPISIGKTSNKIEIHHGDKHDPGYAIKHEEHEGGDFGAGFEVSHKGFEEEHKGLEEHKGFEGFEGGTGIT